MGTSRRKRKRDDERNEFLPDRPAEELEERAYGSLEFNEVLDESVSRVFQSCNSTRYGSRDVVYSNQTLGRIDCKLSADEYYLGRVGAFSVLTFSSAPTPVNATPARSFTRFLGPTIQTCCRESRPDHDSVVLYCRREARF